MQQQHSDGDRRTNGAGVSDPNREPGQATRARADAGGGITQSIADDRRRGLAIGGIGFGLLACLVSAQIVERKMKGGSL